MIAGFRVGWMILSGNKDAAKDYIEGINMLSNMRLCSNVPAQSIVQTALGGYQSVKNYIVPGGRIYEQREYMYKAVNDIPGLSVVKPKAAFYSFPKIDIKKFNIKNDEQFAYDFLKEKRVLIVHGGASTGKSLTISVLYIFLEWKCLRRHSENLEISLRLITSDICKFIIRFGWKNMPI